MKLLYSDDGHEKERSKDAHSDGQREKEELIWEDFKKGSQSALTHIYRNYANPLYNYGCQFCANKELVRDTVQDLFIDIIRSRSRLGRTTSIKFYLFKALRNKLLRAIKSHNNKFLPEDNITQNAFDVVLSPEHLLIHKQLDAEKSRLLQVKINELPALQKEALLLYFYEGLSYDKIAEILSIKTKSARALIYRAIESLGKLVKPFKNTITSGLWFFLLLSN